MIDKDKVLAFVKLKGPVLPKDIAAEFHENTFISGAILSSLVDSKLLKISYGKIGGSPVYYAPGQEEKLSLLYKYLPGKEKEAFDLLKNKKVIREIEVEPAIRVALRNIKDFAKPLEVNIGEKKEIFWKWYLLSNNEAEEFIKKLISKDIVKEKDEKEVNKEDVKKEEVEKTNVLKEEIIKKEEKIKEKEENKEKEKKEIQEKLEEKEGLKFIEKLKDLKEKEENIKKKIVENKKIEDYLFQKIEKIFAEKNIEILEYKIIRKNSDIELLVNINSNVGKLKYFCKVRDKKSNNDKDLSAVYVQGQMKKLPVLYVTTGELTKKAKELLENEFKLISVLKI